MSLLKVQGLSVRIGANDVVRHVSFDVNPGEVFGLVGESGSGKSMTAHALMRLLPDAADFQGEVVLENRRLNLLTERSMCRIRGQEMGMIFQEPMTALNPLQTIGDQVAETLIVHGRARRRHARQMARVALARVGLPEDRFPLGRYPHELSGGQRQRVAIAMAVALRPRLLIADEPTTALDVTTQAGILDLVRRLARDDGMACLLITHDLAVVAGLADRVAVMKDGQIIEQGGTEQLFRRRHHPYTQALFAASSHMPPRAPVDPGPPILSVDQAVRDYRIGRRRQRAVRGVSLTVGKGESVGLVGESGCGKSTLARAILGL